MKKKIEFTSNTIKAYTENDVKIIAFGDDPSSPENYIILSRYDDPSTNIDSIEEMIGIQTSTSAYEVAAAISKISLENNTISIFILDEKVSEVGAEELCANFHLSPSEHASIKKHLREILKGTNISFADN